MRRRRVGFCGVTDQRQSRHCADGQDVVCHGDFADLGMPELFNAVPVGGDVVGGPAGAELCAARCQITDDRVMPGECGERAASACSSPTASSAVFSQSGKSCSAKRSKKMNRAKLGAPVALSNAGAYSARPSGLAARMSKLPFMTIAGEPTMLSIKACTPGLVVGQSQRGGHGPQDVVGDARDIASLDLGVVLGTDPRQMGDLFSPQPGHASSSTRW